MADIQNVTSAQGLGTTTGSGTQGTTQDPQSASAPASNAAQTSSVQPSASNNLLTNVGGIPLQPTALPTANLNQTSTSTTAPAPAAVHHHINVELLGFSGLLFVAAIVLFWTTFRSAKTTTI